MVSLTNLTLDVIDRLFSRVLTQTQSLDTHIHFAISIMYPFFTSVDPRYPCNLPSPHPHTRMQMHPCKDMLHTCVHPDRWETCERSSWSQLGSNTIRDRPIRGVSIRQTHTKGFPSVLLPRSETPSCQQCTPI